MRKHSKDKPFMIFDKIDPAYQFIFNPKYRPTEIKCCRYKRSSPNVAKKLGKPLTTKVVKEEVEEFWKSNKKNEGVLEMIQRIINN